MNENTLNEPRGAYDPKAEQSGPDVAEIPTLVYREMDERINLVAWYTFAMQQMLRQSKALESIAELLKTLTQTK